MNTRQSDFRPHTQSLSRHLNIAGYIFRIFWNIKIAKSYFEFSNCFTFICRVFFSSHDRIYKCLQNTVHTCANTILSTDTEDWQPLTEPHSPPHKAHWAPVAPAIYFQHLAYNPHQQSSTQGDFALQGTFGNVCRLFRLWLGRGYYQRLVSKGHGCCWTSYNAQGRLDTKNYLAKSIDSVDLKKHACITI